MWLMLPTGFYSAVTHRDDPNLLNVRGRSRVDLERLADWYAVEFPDEQPLELHAFTPSDYPWRVFIPVGAYAVFVAQQVLAIDYPNFKSAVDKASSPARHSTYNRVWSALLDIEREPGALTGHPNPPKTWGSSYGYGTSGVGAYGSILGRPLTNLGRWNDVPDDEPDVDAPPTRVAADAYDCHDECPSCGMPDRPQASEFYLSVFRPGSVCPSCRHVEPADIDLSSTDPADPFYVAPEGTVPQ